LLNLQEIFSFIEVAKENGFSKASQKTGLPKSTLSRHVQSLEERLALNLFQRTTRKLTLTPAGEDFFRQAQSLTNALETLEKNFSHRSQKVEGLIRMTCPRDMAGMMLAPSIHSFKQLYPHVRFELVLSDERTDLIDARMDLALRAGKLSDSSFIAKKIMEVQFCLYCARDFSCEEENKDHLPLIDFSRRPFERLVFKSPTRKFTLKQTPIVLTNSLVANAELAAQGMGVCALPSYMGDKYVEEKKLKPFLAECAAMIEPVHVIYPAQAHLPKRVRLFIDHLVKEFSNPSTSKA
jgi:DNA-binding transcriptional LysR family regulator